MRLEDFNVSIIKTAINIIFYYYYYYYLEADRGWQA